MSAARVKRRVDCGGGSAWRSACAKGECATCGTFELTHLPPKGCTCAATPVGGCIYLMARVETCPEHGRCDCDEWVDVDADYDRLRYSGACPRRAHSSRAGQLA